MTSTQPRRIALVLGSGGIVGGAFHAGVLKALYDTWAVDARQVDLIVGTSAGSIAGALSAAGMHPNDVFRRETGQTLSPSGQRILARGRHQRPPKPSAKTSIGRPAAPEALLKALTRPWSVSPGGVAAALLPRGSAPTTHVASLVTGLLGPDWPQQPALRVCAVDVASASRVILEQGGCATPSQAIAASCAVPAVFEPVKINGRDYYDGGVHSADNLDVRADDSFDLVVVSSPMSLKRASLHTLPWDAFRSFTRWQTDRERQKLASCDRVEIVSPTDSDLDAMGNNMLDPKRRPAVALQAHTTACAQFSNGSPL